MYGQPVRDLIPARAANTALLAVPALVFASVVGLALGVVSGSGRGGIVANVIRSVSLVLLSMPPLLTSLFLVFVAARTGWLPIAGMHSAFLPQSGPAARALDLVKHLIVPAAAIALPLAAMFERLQSQAMRDVIRPPSAPPTPPPAVPRPRVTCLPARTCRSLARRGLRRPP